jgi:protein tyrosine phosphatase
VRASERDRAAPRDIDCLVYFLDNTQHKFVVDRRSKGQVLLDCVFKHLNLIETDFFGLKYLPQSTYYHQHHNRHDSASSTTTATANNYSNNGSKLESPSHKLTRSNQSNGATNSSSLVAATNNAIIDSDSGNHNDRHSSSSNPSLPSQSPTLLDRNTASNQNGKQGIQSSMFNVSITSNNDDNSSEFIEERWLDPVKSIRKQYKSGPPYKFYFRVRFYVSDPGKLADDTTRNHLYLQLKQDIINNRLMVPTSSAILLASYILQSEFGDYDKKLLEENYASKIKLLPIENDNPKQTAVIELHKEHRRLSPADAEYQFLEHAAKELDCYGVEFYDAKDQCKTDILIGVSSSGIVVFRDNKRISQFSWAKIIKIMFKKKMFSIQLRRDEGQNCDNFIEFNLLSNQACKSFWEECVAQHSFFRLHQPKSPPKKFFSFLNFGSKFQYNGKTEYQTMEESRKRTFSHFSRSLSKRYARRTLPIGRPLWSDQTAQNSNSDTHSRISNSSSSSNSRTILNNHSSTLAESIKVIKEGIQSNELILDFEKLSRKKEDESHEESRLMENIDKNRYQDILPYDSTRVQLLDSMTGDYINASFVDMAVPDGSVNRYIATQGPLSSTCDDFWQMVWEQNCSLIIMVTPLIEAGRVKCHKYWPEEKEEVRYGQIIVRNLNEKSKAATIDRTIQLTDAKSGEKRLTTQIQYKAWPDHEVPEDCSDFLKLVNRVKKHRAIEPKDPVVVHCSAGIGRTGVLILMETAICIMEAGEPIYPIKILHDMRKQRAMLIQTSSQFKFVAEAICKVYDQKLYKKSKKSRKK